MADSNRSGAREKEDEQQQGVKIVDRRRFDTSGEERIEGESSKAQVAQVSTSLEPDLEGEAGEDLQNDQFQAGDITLSSFIMSLATQALMQLGEIAAPPGYDLPQDKAAAKQTIDLLSMLEAKFKSGISQPEAELLEEVLHNLRMSFVKKV